MVLRCYPCIRGCAYVKVVLGVVLLLLAVYMLAMTPIVLNCAHVRSSCPQKFGTLLDEMAGTPNAHIAKEAAVNDYCDCLISCMNYMGVFHRDGQNADPGNCFLKSNAAGVKSSIVMGKKHDDEKAETLLPGVGNTDCFSCADASSAQDSLYMSLVILASVCGVALFVSAGCEHLEVKHHNISFTVCTVGSDIICAIALTLACVMGSSGANLAASGCRPMSFQEVFTDAGEDSTLDNLDGAVLFSQFFMDTFQDGLTSLCSEERTLHVYSLVTAFGIMSCFWSFLATCCVCVGISDDGEDSDEDLDNFHSQELQDLMKFGQGYRFTRRRG